MKKLLPVALSIAGVVLIGQSAIAAPDNFFSAYMTELRSVIPEEIYIKLPSKLGIGVDLKSKTIPITYPSYSRKGIFRITLCIKSSIFTNENEAERTCPSYGYIGHILTGKINHPEIKRWLTEKMIPEPGVTRDYKLGNNVTAKCWGPKARHTKAKPYCVWKEGDQGFIVYGFFDVESTSKSMVRETKIYRP
jgi:hypothetical protein